MPLSRLRGREKACVIYCRASVLASISTRGRGSPRARWRAGVGDHGWSSRSARNPRRYRRDLVKDCPHRFPLAFHRGSVLRSARVIAPEQLDIFIPLRRGERLRQWAELAIENNVDLERPTGLSAFAEWLRSQGHAPPELGHEAVTVLVAVMHDYERETLETV